MSEHINSFRTAVGALIVVIGSVATYYVTESTESLITLWISAAIFVLSFFHYIYDSYRSETTTAKGSHEISLSAEAHTVLLGCTRTPDRYLHLTKNMHFTILEAGKVELFKGKKESGEDLWVNAISSLEQYGMIRRVGKEKFEITNVGVSLADNIRFDSFQNKEGLKRLTYPARDMLMYAANHPAHEIIHAETLTETEIKVGDREFCNTGYMSDYRNAKEAFAQLLDLDLIEDTGAGFSYEVTWRGDDVAEALDRVTIN
ncbi:hypothetical protein [Gimesia algae]|uniref:Uncharacterized protein n=1 Tax=Gimesia algae TaxID=2527971 RepID=A0A517V7J4_9PLAN|nr:hypothetical protein [Gimesia algae]QDT88975.1 hypothetical protein Pan161_05940 [Gimesia algae]